MSHKATWPRRLEMYEYERKYADYESGLPVNAGYHKALPL